ncbi:MAG: alpha/beta hydrolase [Frankiales bacterium]|nr:alpha/beta hydrolase [Frankiales bacterium]
MSSEQSVSTITLPDGRTLAYAEWGDPDGHPVVNHHGTPGCRLNRHPNQELLRSTGARVITFDRAGYGASSRNAGRSVVDIVPDVVALADALGVERFAVMGGSGGGPHALATAALLPDRVTRVACIVGAAPYDAMGHDAWFAGMDPENVKEFGKAVEGEQAAYEHLVGEDAAMCKRVAEDPSHVLGDFELPEADRAVLGRPDVASVIVESVEEQTRNGVWGWVDDDLAFVKPWGFDPATVSVPVALWWGEADVLVPPAHGEWLASVLPQAVKRVSRDAGHQMDPDRDVLLLQRWLQTGEITWPEE